MKVLFFLILMATFLVGCTKCSSNEPSPVPPVEDTTGVVPDTFDLDTVDLDTLN